MADQFLGEVRIVPFNFAPYGWATCDGQILPISQNSALFSLLGVNFGGNGTSNFGLPNLQGLTPIGQGDGPGLTPRVIGETGGSADVTLLSTEIPPHSHGTSGDTSTATSLVPTGCLPAAPVSIDPRNPSNLYDSGAATTPTYPNDVGPTGNNFPHTNMQPYLSLTFIISLTGIFPARG
jgi:microcystin-dependent protein